MRKKGVTGENTIKLKLYKNRKQKTPQSCKCPNGQHTIFQCIVYSKPLLLNGLLEQISKKQDFPREDRSLRWFLSISGK